MRQGPVGGGAPGPGDLMAAEMAEQPAALSRLIARRAEFHDVVASLVPRPLAGVVLVARGSSDNAAVFARYVLEVASGRPVSLAAPSLHTAYETEIDYEGYLAIGISQSGETPEVVSVLERLSAAGARTLGMSNRAGTPLERAAEGALTLEVGDERAVPATKTFTAELVALAFVAEALGRAPWCEGDWESLPAAVEQVLADGQSARSCAAAIAGSASLITVGRGYLYAIALEAALKLKETTSIAAEGYSAADLRHGPLVVVDPGFPAVAFCARGPLFDDMRRLVRALEERTASIVEVGDSDSADLRIPAGLPEALTAVPAVVRAQQLAHATSLLKGLDPDRPAGLTKITRTR